MESKSKSLKSKKSEKTETGGPVKMVMLIDQSGFFGDKESGDIITCRDEEQAEILKSRGIAEYLQPEKEG